MTVDEKKLRQILREQFYTKTELNDKFYIKTELDDKFNTKTELDTTLAGFFGELSRNSDKRFDQLEASKADRSQVEKLQNSVDGIVKHMDDDDTERAAINSQLDRHQSWIDELADNTKTKLSTP